MKIVLYLIGVLTASLWQMSCGDSFTRLIEVDYSDHKTKGVIFGILANRNAMDSAFTNFDTYTVGQSHNYYNRIYISNSYPSAYGRHNFYSAHVNLISDQNDIFLDFHEKDQQLGIYDPFYTVEDPVVPGRIYQIIAEYDPDDPEFHLHEWSPVSARDTMPAVVTFTFGETHLEHSTGDFSPQGGYIDIRINDEPDRRNVFLVEVSGILPFGSDTNSHSRLMYASIQRPDKNDELDIFDNIREELFYEEDFTKEGHKRIYFHFIRQEETYNREKPAILLVRLTNMSDNYIRFQRSADQYELNKDNPFAEPVEIYTNVENGYGIFALASRSYGSILVE